MHSASSSMCRSTLAGSDRYACWTTLVQASVTASSTSAACGQPLRRGQQHPERRRVDKADAAGVDANDVPLTLGRVECGAQGIGGFDVELAVDLKHQNHLVHAAAYEVRVVTGAVVARI